MERDEKILDYIDGLLSTEEAERVRCMISANAEWKDRYDSFVALHVMLKQEELLFHSISFVDQTMAKLEAEIQTEKKHNSPIFQFFQLTSWLWFGLTMLFFADFSIFAFSQLVQQDIVNLVQIGKNTIHLLFNNSAMFWALGVLLWTYVFVKNYEKNTSLFNVIVS